MNLIDAIEAYVQRKLSDGLTYRASAWYLRALGKHVGSISLERVSAREILKFLDSPKTSSGTSTWMIKYRLFRGFFDYWMARGEIGALPMPVKRVTRQRPFIRYIYTPSEIRTLLKAARECQKEAQCSLDAVTLRNILIFLYGTGTLLGEALRLLVEDVDLKKGAVTIRGTPFSRSRTIPICADLCSVLEKHIALRQRRSSKDSHVFLSKGGTSLNTDNVVRTFRRLRQLAGVRRHDDATYQPRMHDIRHTFAVHRIAGWIKHGADLNRMLPALAVYMGLAGLRSTEPYLSLTPERFRAQLMTLSPQRGKKRWRDDPELMRFLAQLSRDCGQNGNGNLASPKMIPPAATGQRPRTRRHHV